MGGGGPSQTGLSDHQRRVIAIIGTDSVEGCGGPRLSLNPPVTISEEIGVAFPCQYVNAFSDITCKCYSCKLNEDSASSFPGMYDLIDDAAACFSNATSALPVHDEMEGVRLHSCNEH